MKYLKTYKLFESVVTELDYSGEDREFLPELPKSLKILVCDNNQLKSLPKLPESLEILHCEDNQLKSLPKLPESLETLYCVKNKLKSLPELPNSLKELWCYDNQLNTLPKLPESLEYLCCYKNPLECLIPDKFIHYQDKEWLDYHYYPMINSYEGQKKILQNDITQLEKLKKIGLDPKIKEEYIDIIKQTDWS